MTEANHAHHWTYICTKEYATYNDEVDPIVTLHPAFPAYDSSKVFMGMRRKLEYKDLFACPECGEYKELERKNP